MFIPKVQGKFSGIKQWPADMIHPFPVPATSPIRRISHCSLFRLGEDCNVCFLYGTRGGKSWQRWIFQHVSMKINIAILNLNEDNTSGHIWLMFHIMNFQPLNRYPQQKNFWEIPKKKSKWPRFFQAFQVTNFTAEQARLIFAKSLHHHRLLPTSDATSWRPSAWSKSTVITSDIRGFP